MVCCGKEARDGCGEQCWAKLWGAKSSTDGAVNGGSTSWRECGPGSEQATLPDSAGGSIIQRALYLIIAVLDAALAPAPRLTPPSDKVDGAEGWLTAIAESLLLSSASAERKSVESVETVPSRSAGSSPPGASGRTPLKVLLDEHRQAIGELRAALKAELALPAPAGEVMPYDDLWLLRYVLSFAGRGGVEAATEAARKCLAWRRQNGGIIAAAATRIPPAVVDTRAVAAFELFGTAGVLTVSKLGDPVFLGRVASSDFARIVESVSVEHLECLFGYMAEASYQFLDQQSRQVGHLVKNFVICDLTNASLIPDRRWLRAASNNSKLSEWLYPQKEMKVVFFRAPRWVVTLSRVMQHLVSKSTAEKFHFHCYVPAMGDAGCDVARCPFASQYLEISDVPRSLGGPSAVTGLKV